MAWLDDRAWCHPKLVNLTDRPFRAYVNGISYAAGMGTGGTLTEAQQKLCGADKRVRKALIEAGLWDAGNDLAFENLIVIHDWSEHNGKRDARRKADRERKRIERGFAPKSPQDSPQDTPQDVHRTGVRTSTGQARAEGSEGSEKKNPKAFTFKADVTANELDPEKTIELGKLIEVLRDVNGTTWNTLSPLAAQVPFNVLADLRIRAKGKGTGWIIRALQAEIRALAA